MVFQSDRAKEIRRQHSNNLTVLASTCVLSAVMTFTMLSGRSQSNSFKGMSILFSMFVSGAGLVVAEKSKKVEAFNTSEDILESTAQSYVLGTEATIQKMLAETNAKEQQAWIVESLPEYKQARYVQEYQLQGLVMPLQDRSLPQVAQAGQIQSTIEVRPQLPTFNAKTAQMVDTSWMGHAFFFDSGVVTGNKGSGKSQLLALIAANILAIAPDVDLKIHNLHYDPTEFKWFPNMPDDVERSFFIKNADEMYQDILNVEAEMNRRVDEEDFNGRPVFRICDEFQAMGARLGKDRLETYVKAIIQIKNQGRKAARKIDGKNTGMNVIVGTHSIKKGQTGIDDSFFDGMAIFLGNASTQASAVYPGDFDMKDLNKQMEAVKGILIANGLMNPQDPLQDRARPAIIRTTNLSVAVRVLPRPDLSGINYQVVDNSSNPKVTLEKGSEKAVKTQGDWLKAFVDHARQNRKMPTDKEVFDFFLAKTGKHVPPEFIADVKKLIGEELS
ncbi:hypothetical protein [Chroococcidiopsis sp.]|uniref:hypothetical protein n=1 Tax=Chroococcidiopsis sp. TaxID=3088168 RepID=UPI003F2D294E